MVFFLIEKHQNASCRNKKRPFGKSVLCYPGYCGLKWGRGRVFKIETIKVGREAPASLKGRVFKIKENSLRNFYAKNMAVAAPLQGALREHAAKA